jgi:O-antigen/teichoic acid export membrane protein
MYDVSERMDVETKLPTAVSLSWTSSREQFRRRLSGLAEMKGIWAIVDQGVVSLGNFLMTIILARSFSLEVYGVWTVIFGFILLLNVVHYSLIVYPLLVRAASQDEVEAQQLVSGALVLTIMLAVPLGLVLFGASMVINRPSLGLWACVALLCWQVQETTRRALMARLAYRKALAGDAISYLGQALLVWFLARQAILSPQLGFAVIAVTCLGAAIVQAGLLRLRLNARFDIRKLSNQFWHLGHWVLWSNLSMNVSLQTVPWSLFLLRGAGDAAGFQAVSNLLGFSHPIILSLGNIIVPAAARARIKNGLSAARRIATIHALQGGLLLLPYFAALLIFPRQLLSLLYGSTSPYIGLNGALRLLALAYVVYFLSLATKFLLNALEENRAQFVAEFVSSSFLVVIIVPSVIFFGVSGAIVALGVWFTVRLAGNAVILQRVK